MKKKALLAALLALCLALTACGMNDIEEAYKTALEQSSVPASAQPTPTPTPSPSPKPTATPAPTAVPAIAPAEVEWPEGVPELDSYKTLIEEKWQSDGSFKAQLLVTQAQLSAWEARMAAAGFASSPATAAGWSAAWSKTSQSGGDYRVAIEITKAAEPAEAVSNGMPAGFEAFPAYCGVGGVTYTATSGAGGLKQLILTSDGETGDGLKKYVDALTAAGFTFANGVYSKTVGGLTYTSDGGMWADAATMRMTLEVKSA